MGKIGNLGDVITFEVSSDKVLTFRNMKRDISSRWAFHPVIGRKPVAEFLGPDVLTCKMDIYLTVMHGVSPRRTIGAIDTAIMHGTPLRFILGGVCVSTYKWVITSASESWNEIIQDGILCAANMNITLQEYYVWGVKGGKWDGTNDG